MAVRIAVLIGIALTGGCKGVGRDAAPAVRPGDAVRSHAALGADAGVAAEAAPDLVFIRGTARREPVAMDPPDDDRFRRPPVRAIDAAGVELHEQAEARLRRPALARTQADEQGRFELRLPRRGQVIVEVERFRFTPDDRGLYCGEFGDSQAGPIDLAAAPAVVELAPLVSMIDHCGE